MYAISFLFPEPAKALIFNRNPKMKLNFSNKYLNCLYLVSVMLLSAACSDTPNNVTISQEQGQCVQLSQYNSSSATPGIALAFPMLESNPTTTTPYCMAITIQNNNAGTNANNIVVVGSGVQLSTTIPGTTVATTGTIYDFYAANVGPEAGESQIFANLAVFDPNNCTATTGANVQTLTTGGGACTFYLQILNESSPVGVYPYTLTYNYTNGNQNYSTSTTINQRVYLYGGDYFSSGLYFMSTNAMTAATNTTTPASWQLGLPNDPMLTVRYILEGQYGFVDFAAGNSVYYFNGIDITQIGSTLPETVSSLAYDGSGNLYASTTGQGMWVYNISESSPNWVHMNDDRGNLSATSNIIGLKGYQFSTSPTNTVYAITESTAYLCSVNGSSKESCILSPSGPSSNAPSALFTNAIDVDNIGTLYAGAGYANDSTLGVTKLDNGFTGNWTPYTSNSPPPYITVAPAATGVGGVHWTNQNQSGYSLFFGAIGNPLLESTVYSCVSSTCSPLISNTGIGGNPLFGNAYTVTTDGTGNLYVGGSALDSHDYQESVTTDTTTGAILLFGQYTISGVGAGTWTPILQIESTETPVQINTTAVASMLTSY